MNRDLLTLYLKSNAVGLLFYIVIGFIFVYTRMELTTYLGTNESQVLYLTFALAVSILCGYFAYKQQRYYQELLDTKAYKQGNVYFYVLTIILHKLVYLIPWLVFMFWPFETRFFYDQAAGYAFVICAITVATATSAAFFPIFIFDVLIPVFFAASIVFVNRDHPETVYISLVLFFFTSLAFFLGHRTRTTSLQLVQSRTALDTARLRAEKSSAEKSDFLAVMSHEIRTPMTGIMGMVDFLKRTELTDEQQAYLSTIEMCSDSLLNTLNDALDLSKIEAGEISIKQDVYDMYEILNGACNIMRPLAEEKNLSFTLDIEDDVPQLTVGDSNRLTQILLNLISNAIKFTSQGEVTVRIALNGEYYKIDVVDTGVGISADGQKKLFRKFSQIQESFKAGQQASGTGLGLAITKNLIEVMGGTIAVESTAGDGAAFTFTLLHQEPSDGQEEYTAKKEEQLEGAYTVLVVEDNKINTMVLVKILEEAGHTVTAVENGDQALDSIQDQAFDIILMDINLPGMSGIEVTREIRKLDKRYKDIPVVAITANVMNDQLQRYVNAGMTGYIMKPFNPRDIHNKVVTYASGEVDNVAFNEVGALQKEHPSIEILAEQFGKEYMQHYVESTLSEVDRLYRLVETSIENSNLSAAEDAAHDLVTITGSLDMTETSDLSRKIEAFCQMSDEEKLLKVFEEFRDAMKSEKSSVISFLDQ